MPQRSSDAGQSVTMGGPATTATTPTTNGCDTAGAIALTAISKWFDTADGEPLTVLQNIELAVPAHSIFAILGASGCGKSTLLNIISGILTPDRGQVCFGGVRSRVALARSLVTDPAILLMDEPFSRLDAQTRAQMHEELLQIHALKHMTIVFVTHDVEEAVVLADEVVVLAPRPGRVREIVPIACARPRDSTHPQAVQYIQRLRALI